VASTVAALVHEEVVVIMPGCDQGDRRDHWPALSRHKVQQPDGDTVPLGELVWMALGDGQLNHLLLREVRWLDLRVHADGWIKYHAVVEEVIVMVHAASSAARSDTAAAAAPPSFFSILFLLRAGDDEARSPSRTTRAPLLRPLVDGGDVGSVFTVVLGIAARGADPQLRVVDLDADPDEDDDAMRRGILELPCRRDTEGTAAGGGIHRTG
jgi:hypothetical protein